MQKELKKLRKAPFYIYGLWATAILICMVMAPAKSEHIRFVAIIVSLLFIVAGVLVLLNDLHCPHCSHQFYFMPIPSYCPECGNSLDPKDFDQTTPN